MTPEQRAILEKYNFSPEFIEKVIRTNVKIGEKSKDEFLTEKHKLKEKHRELVRKMINDFLNKQR